MLDLRREGMGSESDEFVKGLERQLKTNIEQGPDIIEKIDETRKNAGEHPLEHAE